ncbi:MAG: hypothetical protein UX26_C0038G0003 [Parcubacteria group bacterium GW2011_GWC1_45_9]|nr:MAG: hypothetical protein UX26_C0038G0003 [Parcubacteria group bacterium GW2011_GWC1_45_9]
MEILKKLFVVFVGLLVVVLALLVFRFFYLKGMLRFRLTGPEPTPVVSSLPASPKPSASLAPSPSGQASASPVPKGKLVRIDVDDTAAGMYNIDAKQGTKITLTLSVMSFNVSRGGLDFRSPLISTGLILPGSSKTIEFVASNSLVFTPYYANSLSPAPYTIKVNVFAE